ncbi:hypothetical protein JOF56_009005 [Kibdelosporangium banguiense]|uniref:Uncharacterized protein n=1 Tax=Kibdelosporangium banguiense TaxID=1365924 RepID=A0ABS4TW47_9PSEU|nr:hypothetical protein [Kibdelosporangium banguiense]
MSTGFVARAHERSTDRLERAGFDQTIGSALAGDAIHNALTSDPWISPLATACRGRANGPFPEPPPDATDWSAVSIFQ